MTTKYKITISPTRIISLKGDRMIAWVTENGILKFSQIKFIHFHTCVKGNYTHIGDWELLSIDNESQEIDNLQNVYHKCILGKRVD